MNLIRKLSSFTYLNATQFIAAFNDNVYKLLMIYFLIQLQGIEHSHTILSLAGAIFVLPFLLFSAASGVLADRYSKRNIIIVSKTLEFVVLGFGVLAFYYESVIGCYTVLFMMASLSSMFAPCKYGILPELVSPDKISRANGLMTSFTFLAIILGTFCASFLLEITNKHFIVAALFSLFMALIASITSFCITYTPPAGSTKPFTFFFLGEIASTLKSARQYPSLLMAMFGSAFFLFLGAFVQLNMIPFAVQSLHLSDIQGGYLFLLTAIGIGTGAIIAGKISGKSVELGLVPLAGVGVMACCFLIDLFSHQLYAVIPLVVILGLFGGMYQIPLDTYVQVTSPNSSRGQIVAATNFLSFFGVLCASGLIYLLSEVFGLEANTGFTVMGVLTFCITLFIVFQLFDYLTRFIGVVLSRLRFRTTFSGLEHIPENSPAIFVCTHTAWNDTLILLGAQRHRLRFFIEGEWDRRHPWIKRVYKMLRIVMVPSNEPIEANKLCLAIIKNTLKRGISVCLLIKDNDVDSKIKKLKTSSSFLEAYAENRCPIIPVSIHKSTACAQPNQLSRILKRFRVPAAVSFAKNQIQID